MTARIRLLFELALAIFWLAMWEACRALPTDVPALGEDTTESIVLESSEDLRHEKQLELGNVNAERLNPDVGLSALEDVPNWVDEWDAPKEFVEWFSYYLSGYDNDGSPVYIFDYGHWKPLEALREAGPERTTEIVNKYMQQGIYKILRHGRENNHQGVVIIIDFEGFTILHYSDITIMQLFLKLWSHFDQIYSVLNYALLINTNFAAENFIRLVSPLWGNILDKCEIYGTLKSKWLPQMLRRIPKSELPPWFGGDEDWRPLWIGGVGKGESNFTGKV